MTSSLTSYKKCTLTGAIAAAIFFVGSHAMGSTLAVRDSRPVAKAIEELEKRFGWQITYEDLPYKSADQPANLAPLVTESAKPPSRTPMPDGTLEFSLPSPGQDPFVTLDGLVKTYNSGKSGNAFAIVRGTRLLHTVPKDVAGAPIPAPPVLDTLITVRPKTRGGDEFLNEVCKQTSRVAGVKIGVGTSPSNDLSQLQILTGGTKVPARRLLERLMLQNQRPLTWRLNYVPGLKQYILNVHPVGVIGGM
jgi:hypothetical protein